MMRRATLAAAGEMEQAMAWLREKSEPKPPKVGLILAGGGARAAYQVGVLRAIARMRAPDARNPFPILCGTSAGAINATALAIYGEDFQDAVARLLGVWGHFHVEQVFRADLLGLSRSAAHWFGAMMLGGLGRFNPTSLFDRSPLRELLERYLPCERIAEVIASGAVEALSITASGYSSGESVTFYQSREAIEPWQRVNRVGCPTTITLDHLMASSAIPFMFEAVRINREYFGDGSMRQLAPISPALHLGADKVLVIGVQGKKRARREQVEHYPSMAQIAGHVLNSIFLDGMDVDLERLQRINRTLELIPDRRLASGEVTLRRVDVMVISPSRDIGRIAAAHAHHLPRALRYFLRGIGAMGRNGTELLSYLLFERAYCRELMALGYNDTLKQRDRIKAFLAGDGE